MTNPYLSQNEKEMKNEKIENAVNNSATMEQNNLLQNIMPNFNSGNFLQGVLIGAVASYILTNENAQQAIFKSVVRMGKLLQAGTEELKERFEDAKAEIEAEEN
ncbi:hypothetical protein CBLAS_1364 [Campylobacter blaseri]|uniref:Uncharacterized protein n=1 Tax=Campylobacter blaseri TaxID=2042961 RepID=A0A2P8QYZ2_9BACT|nr:hypothetical protein [Campylobacter blaseri]PSM51464.1 hypothetical protein CQ405_07805 [Campylobacter blaseri]PSM52913.1 hypothetical protein CRN67_07810 [Campylobacter blaseri]QKF86531.1 hypothetical protein CBLAS_1364 [Campylobacter blaseri]